MGRDGIEAKDTEELPCCTASEAISVPWMFLAVDLCSIFALEQR